MGVSIFGFLADFTGRFDNRKGFAMTKRILLFSTLTLFVLFGSAMGAEQKSDADKISDSPNVWTQILGSAPSGAKAEDRLEKHAITPRQGEEGKALSPSSLPWAAKAAGPQDFCPFTAACFDGTLANPCAAPGFPGGELCEYQDPAITCPSPPGCPTYPFEVRSVHILLSNCDPAPCVVLVTPGIREVIDVTCPAPGNIICTGPTVEIVLPPNSPCQEYVIPLDPGCCVNGPYFACLNIRLVDQCNIAPCFDVSCNPCCSYWDQLGGPFVDLCPSFPGNLAIWTDGLLSCQNNCPKPTPECSDGIDNDGDGLIDFPADCGCTDPSDPAEAPNPPTQCSDGVDNDGDGLIDFPADPGCADVCDTDEFNPPPTPEPNHYKTWRTFDLAPPVFRTVAVRDQFMVDNGVRLDSIHFLSNPTTKNAEPIIDPDDHLTWYRARGRDTLILVTYRNQFTPKDSFQIDSVRYLLLPTQKFPHPPFDNLDHYKAYRIRNPQPLFRSLFMQDQFGVDQVSTLIPRYFLTPAQKNASPRYDSVTHYVAYEFFPHRPRFEQRQTQDQFGFHNIRADSSMLLLVPTEKIICPCAKGDLNCVGGFSPADVTCILNCVFLGAAGPPCVCDPCVADVDCNYQLSPADVVVELNRVFLGITTPPWCGS